MFTNLEEILGHFDLNYTEYAELTFNYSDADSAVGTTLQPRSNNQEVEQFGEEKQSSLLRELEAFLCFPSQTERTGILWRLTARLTNAS